MLFSWTSNAGGVIDIILIFVIATVVNMKSDAYDTLQVICCVI